MEEKKIVNWKKERQRGSKLEERKIVNWKKERQRDKLEEREMKERQ